MGASDNPKTFLVAKIKRTFVNTVMYRYCITSTGLDGIGEAGSLGRGLIAKTYLKLVSK